MLDARLRQGANHRRAAVGIALHDQRAADHAGPILHDVQPHAFFAGRFANAHAEIFYCQDNSSGGFLKANQNPFRPAVPDRVGNRFLRDPVKMHRRDMIVEQHRLFTVKLARDAKHLFGAVRQVLQGSHQAFGFEHDGRQTASQQTGLTDRLADMPGDFVLADATVHPFDPASFDLLVSRFGVMFFADPALSFANLRKALKPSGRLAFACWREPRKNPWMMTPLQAVYKHVPKLPQQGPEDPGPFAFASEERVQRILSTAGFAGIKMEACNLSLDIAIGRGLDAAVQGALEIGPASRALDGQPPEVRAAAAHSIREALAPFAKGQAVPLPGSIWIVTARAE